MNLLNEITINNLCYAYEDEEIFNDFNLSINSKETTSIIGPSGCGKSSLLKLITNELKPSKGAVLYNGQNNYHGFFGYMPQNDLLLNWYNTFDNIALGQVNKTIKKSDDELKTLLKTFKLETAINKYPYQLSGGMRSRVSFLRACIMADDILLFDEPLSKLDYITKQETLTFLKDILETFEKTCIMVTHDIEEAIFLSDRIIVLSDAPCIIMGDYRVSRFKKENLKNIIINKLTKEQNEIIIN